MNGSNFAKTERGNDKILTYNKKDFSMNDNDTSMVNPHHPPENGVNASKSHNSPASDAKTGSRTGQKLSLETSLFQALEEFSKEKKMRFSLPHAYLDYVPPKLHKGKTSWYISYYVKNPETGKLRLFRIKVNHFPGVREKMKAAREIMSGLEERLALGWNPLLETKAPRAATQAFTVFESYWHVKQKEMEAQSLRTYKSYIRKFREWLEGNGFTEETLICSITEPVARSFMAYLEEERGLAPCSYNSHLSFYLTFFDWMLDKGYVQVNAFRNIKRKPRRLMKKKRRMLTDDELLTLCRWLQGNNPEYLAACQLCYCCFMRPKEIALLKCGDIDLSRQLVHVRPEIAKNDKESFRTIPDAMLPVLQALDLSRPEMYLFGSHPGDGDNFKPGDAPIPKRKFSNYWERTVRPACGFGSDVQFYSQKDTGITNMLGEGVAINLVQQQADHSSVAMTAIYVGHKATAQEELKAALPLL